MALEFYVQQDVTSGNLVGSLRYHLERTRTALPPTVQGVLLVSTCRGDLLSIGHYHRPPKQSTSSRIDIVQRLSGGRAVPFGFGFVAIALVLPHRSALVSDDPFALAPYQVPNRYVRGVLDALKSLRIAATYPGRDMILVDGKAIAMTTFEVDEGGALLFEVILGVDRDFSLLPSFLETADPDGSIKAEILDSARVSCVRRFSDQVVTASDWMELLCRGFEHHFAVGFVPGAIAQIALDRPLPIAADSSLPLTYATRTQLGVLEVRMALDGSSRIAAIRLIGDFISNSSAIETVEKRLIGCSIDSALLRAVIGEVFSAPANFILGIGSTETIVDTIRRAAGC